MDAPSARELLDTLLRFGSEWYLAAANETLDKRIAGTWRRCAVASDAAREGRSTHDGAAAHADLHNGALTSHLTLVGLPPIILHQVAAGMRVHLGLAIIEQVLGHARARYSGEGHDECAAALEFVTHAVEAHCVAPALQVVNIELHHPDAVETYAPETMQPAIDCIHCYTSTAMVESVAVLSAIMRNDDSTKAWIAAFEPWVLDLSDEES